MLQCRFVAQKQLEIHCCKEDERKGVGKTKVREGALRLQRSRRSKLAIKFAAIVSTLLAEGHMLQCRFVAQKQLEIHYKPPM